MKFALALILSTCTSLGDSVPEAGRVNWRRDLDTCLAPAAIAAAGKPTLVLFQEIPGCSTCVGFGAGPLSHPLVVEWIEDGFVPVLIHNNKGGADKDWLERFDETAWNNPVLRVIGADGKDLVPREEGVWSTPAVIERLTNATHPADAALWRDIAREVDVKHHQTIAFGMHCFWEGEAALGSIDGVVGAQARSLDGREIVVVTYHDRAIDVTALIKRADALDSALEVLARNDEQFDAATAIVGKRAAHWDGASKTTPASDHTHALNASALRFVPLTPMQAMKVNAALQRGAAPATWLTPRQRALATRIAAALAHDANALDGITRPRTIDALWTYTEQLDRALSQ